MKILTISDILIRPNPVQTFAHTNSESHLGQITVQKVPVSIGHSVPYHSAGIRQQPVRGEPPRATRHHRPTCVTDVLPSPARPPPPPTAAAGPDGTPRGRRSGSIRRTSEQTPPAPDYHPPPPHAEDQWDGPPASRRSLRLTRLGRIISHALNTPRQIPNNGKSRRLISFQKFGLLSSQKRQNRLSKNCSNWSLPARERV